MPADLYFSEQLRLAAGLQILQSLTPEAVLWIQQDTICRMAEKPSVEEVKSALESCPGRFSLRRSTFQFPLLPESS